MLGSPATAAQLAKELAGHEVLCFQMDLYQAERLRHELAQRGAEAKVVATADLWDLGAAARTAVYPAADKGERQLKLDMLEQAFHVLQPAGLFAVWSPYERDLLFPHALKKVFGRFHAVEGSLFWARRHGERPRRRHEVTFQVRIEEQLALRFLSRPGVFSFGRFDNGARALVESMAVHPGERVLDLGCGCGTNGIVAGIEGAHVTFVDSNLRATAVTEHNARDNGLSSFDVVATHNVSVAGTYDVILANPPYYADHAIARLFIERSSALLRPGGRLYLVTKQPQAIGGYVEELFGNVETVARRGYVVLAAARP